jgi:hypothetical protein
MGLAPNDLWTHPQDNPQQPPQPDPKVMALQQQVQLKQQQIAQQAQDNQAKLQLMAQKHASDAQIEQAKAQMESDLALRQQNLQAWLDQQQMVLDAHKHAATLDSQAKIQKLRNGGRLDA